MDFGKRVALVALWFVVLPTSVAPAGEGPRKPTISVRPAKPEFLEWEPIAIQVAITNPQAEPIDLVGSDEASPLDLDADPNQLQRIEPFRPAIGSIGGSDSATIRPFWTRTTTTYLQKHFASPRPGTYQVRCRMRIGYATGPVPPELAADWPIRRKPDGILTLDQVVRVSVRAADPAEFHAMVDDYRRRLVPIDPLPKILVRRVHQIGSALHAAAPTTEAQRATSALMSCLDELYQWTVDLYPHRDEDFRVAEAIAGLSVITDEAVIPALAAIIDETDAPESGFLALRRFANAPAARRVVARYLDTDHAAQALEWFSVTGQALSDEELGKLKRREVDTTEYERIHR